MTLDDTEAPVLAACLRLLELRGIPAWRTDSASPDGPIRMPPGWPDITAILPALRDGSRGVFLAIECKRPKGPRCPGGGQLSPSQRDFGRRVTLARGMYWIIHDVAVLARLLDEFLDPSWHRPADFDFEPAALTPVGLRMP